MTEYIKIDSEQHGFVQRYVKEANISLNYLKDKGEDITDALENYRNVLSMIEAVNRFNADHFEYDVTKAINTLKTYWDCGTMTPLTLKPDEFNNYYSYFDKLDYSDNIRCGFIKKRGDNIYNFKAYKAEVNKCYVMREDMVCCKCIKSEYICHNNPKIYLSAGGVITGNYVRLCKIKDEDVKRGEFTFKGSVTIQVNNIVYPDGHEILYTDIRNKKLNVLRHFYDVQTKFNSSFKKIDVRRFIIINE